MLRKATDADYNALYEIYMDKSVNPFLSFEIMSPQEFHPIFEELHAGGELLVYEQAEQVAATCVVTRLKRRMSHIVQITTLAVHPAYQGKGVGTAFMNALFNQLRKTPGVKRAELSLEEDNSRAMQFYKKLGFEMEGTLRQWVKRATQDHYVDEHIMGIIL